MIEHLSYQVPIFFTIIPIDCSCKIDSYQNKNSKILNKKQFIDFSANTLKRRIIKSKKQFIQYTKEII